jgi:hypothetical protein
MSGWGCPHEANGQCMRVLGRACDPGMKGCVLFGRFVFSNPDKNRPAGPRRRVPTPTRGPKQEPSD